MASISNLFLPSGTLKVFYNRDTDRNKLMADLIEMWMPYCEDNWLCDNHEAPDSPERKVKRLLDSAAYFILYGNVEDTITLYKAKRNKEHEVPLFVNNSGVIFYEEQNKDDAPKAVKSPTRQDKIRRIRSAHPGICLTEAIVDVDGRFTYEGREYLIDESVRAYQPQWVKGELFYECDKVYIGRTGDGICFYTQNLEPLDGLVHNNVKAA